MEALQSRHPTLYWNVVVLAVVASLDCDLQFLQLPRPTSLLDSGRVKVGGPGARGLSTTAVSRRPFSVAKAAPDFNPASPTTGSRLFVRTMLAVERGSAGLGTHSNRCVVSSATAADLRARRTALTRHQSMGFHVRTSPAPVQSGVSVSAVPHTLGLVESTRKQLTSLECPQLGRDTVAAHAAGLRALGTKAAAAKAQIAVHKTEVVRQLADFQALLTAVTKALVK